MATQSDVLASIAANLQQAMERKKPREIVINLLASHLIAFSLRRQLNLKSMGKFERAASPSHSPMLSYFDRSRRYSAVIPCILSKASAASSPVMMHYVFSSPMTMMWTKWSPLQKRIKRRRLVSCWPGRRDRVHLEQSPILLKMSLISCPMIHNPRKWMIIIPIHRRREP